MTKTEILVINKTNFENCIVSAAEHLKKGEVILVPTETVYGLICDAFNEKAVQQIYKLKKRPPAQPLQLLIADKKDAEKYFLKINPRAKKLIREEWPGPLTLISTKTKAIPDHISKLKVGLRMPDHSFMLQLIRAFGSPVAATSANISGKQSPVTLKEAMAQIQDVPLAIDGGRCVIGKSSKVIDATGNSIVIIRA